MFDLIGLSSKDKSLGVYEDLILGLGPRGCLPAGKSFREAEEGLGLPLPAQPSPALPSNVITLLR